MSGFRYVRYAQVGAGAAILAALLSCAIPWQGWPFIVAVGVVLWLGSFLLDSGGA